MTQEDPIPLSSMSREEKIRLQEEFECVIAPIIAMKLKYYAKYSPTYTLFHDWSMKVTHSDQFLEFDADCNRLIEDLTHLFKKRLR